MLSYFSDGCIQTVSSLELLDQPGTNLTLILVLAASQCLV
jgi:hypothetical protein